MFPIHQVWPKPSCKAQWKGEEDKADKGRGGRTTSGNGQAWSSASPRGQWRTGKNGDNWLQNHLWVPQRPSRLRDWWWCWWCAHTHTHTHTSTHTCTPNKHTHALTITTHHKKSILDDFLCELIQSEVFKLRLHVFMLQVPQVQCVQLCVFPTPSRSLDVAACYLIGWGTAWELPQTRAAVGVLPPHLFDPTETEKPKINGLLAVTFWASWQSEWQEKEKPKHKTLRNQLTWCWLQDLPLTEKETPSCGFQNSFFYHCHFG